MTKTLTFSPCFSYDPGTLVLHGPGERSVRFSIANKSGGSLLLHLVHLKTQQETVYAFPEGSGYGALYSVRAEGLSPSEYGYFYTLDGAFYPDPLARAVLTGSPSDHPLYGFFLPNGDFPVKDFLSVPLREQILYGLHVKGFTRTDASVPQKLRGTCEGVVAKIPYLRSLSVNAIECMPVYVPAKSENNYWGYGTGYYYALNPAFSATGNAEESFLSFLSACHENGILLYLQFHFPETFSAEEALRVIRFYRTAYGIDGIRLIGIHPVASMIADDPLLQDLYLLTENTQVFSPERKRQGFIDRSSRHLLRRFAKGDAGILRDFVRLLLQVGGDQETVSSLTDFSGFTAFDLVSYNWKHNENNGEENRDGEDYNDSWNCGVEGPSSKKEIKALRMRQIRNLFTVLAFSQGALRLREGDEVLNEQGGNNNPYCQDNEVGWVQWKKTAPAKETLSFVTKLLSLRSSLRLLHKDRSILMSTGKDKVLPEVSLHGKEAWKPSFQNEDRTIGIVYKGDGKEDPYAVCLALNMHWKRQELGLPHLPDGYVWALTMDTFQKDPFPEMPQVLTEQHHLLIRERSVQILTAVPESR